MATNMNMQLNSRLYSGTHVMGVVKYVSKFNSVEIANQLHFMGISEFPLSNLGTLPQPLLQRLLRNLVKNDHRKTKRIQL